MAALTRESGKSDLLFLKIALYKGGVYLSFNI